jgi:mannose-6-phosphate isomerase-like protein (cupin superfamily)
MTSGSRDERRGFLAAASAAVLGVLGDRSSAQPAQGQRFHRRVVTGVTASGKSTVVSDGPVPGGGWTSKEGDGADLWLLQRVPVDLSDQRDPIAGYTGQEWPPPGGVIVRILTWQPGFSYRMHRSATIDFVVIVSGRLELLLDDGTVKLGPGDCVVQRGTNHGWRVVGGEPCTFAAVLVAATA